jgi:hypothetical protein
MAGSPPIIKLEAWPLKIAVWENTITPANGKSFKTYSVKLVRVYMDKKTNKWEETTGLSDKDLLGAAALLTEVWRTISVKEGKTSAAAAQPESYSPSRDEGDHPF